VLAAIYLEEYADQDKWYNRLIELNIQNLAAVPSVVYGILGLGLIVRGPLSLGPVVLAGAIILALLILPVIIISSREAIRAVPDSLRDGSLALGATRWQTIWRTILPNSVPGIATGSILALSRAIGEAAPLIIIGVAGFLTFNPASVFDRFTALPIQIYSYASRPQEEFIVLSSALIVVLLVILLAMNSVAIFIRNKYQRRW
jgi:phosphate transport system permease protein